MEVLPSEEALSPTARLAVVRRAFACRRCERPMRAPPLFRCGHSTHCLECWREARPGKCDVCGDELRRGQRPPVNVSLDAVLRVLLREDYANRPEPEARGGEEARCPLRARVDAELALDCEAAQRVRAEGGVLGADHEAEVCALARRWLADARARRGGGGTGGGVSTLLRRCKCGLLMLPKRSHRQQRWFFACPRFPDSQRCKSFLWLTAAATALVESCGDGGGEGRDGARGGVGPGGATCDRLPKRARTCVAQAECAAGSPVSRHGLGSSSDEVEELQDS